MKELTNEEYEALRGNEKSLDILIRRGFFVNPVYISYVRGIINSNKDARAVHNLFLMENLFNKVGFIDLKILGMKYNMYTLKSFDV